MANLWRSDTIDSRMGTGKRVISEFQATKLKGLKTTCPKCQCRSPAYRISKRGYYNRIDTCPSCRFVKPLSQVQWRRYWSYFPLIENLATMHSSKTGIDSTMIEERAAVKLETFARRYSTLNNTRFRTYVDRCLPASLTRWSKPNCLGGKSLRISNESQSPSERLAPAMAEVWADHRDCTKAVDAADTLRKAKCRLTAKEWRTLEKWSRGELKVKPDALLIKAQRLIQGAN